MTPYTRNGFSFRIFHQNFQRKLRIFVVEPGEPSGKLVFRLKVENNAAAKRQRPRQVSDLHAVLFREELPCEMALVLIPRSIPN